MLPQLNPIYMEVFRSMLESKMSAIGDARNDTVHHNKTTVLGEHKKELQKQNPKGNYRAIEQRSDIKRYQIKKR